MAWVAMLRGVNVGSANRLAMADLRTALGDAGLEEVRTYVQSGNIVCSWDADGAALAGLIAKVIRDGFGLSVAVLVRDDAELTDVAARNPFPKQAMDQPKLLQVTFLSQPAGSESVERARELAGAGELIEASGRELYTWHPAGIARSKLALSLVKTAPSGAATSRNWATVTKLITMIQ